ncbi:MAG: LacI family DNA-binding transcriptional regulator [Bacteroidales bacterium]
MMKREITIKDIAKELGIHHATVSRALQGSTKVKEETRNQILQEAKKLGYTPNILAQSFRNGRTNIVSFIVPDLKHHFFSRLISSITELAREKGFMIVIFQSNDDPEVEKEIIDSLISLRIAGVAVSVGLKTKSTSHFDKLKEEGIPLVFFDRVPINTPFSTITLDNYNSIRMVVNELTKKQKKSIAYISFDGYTSIFKDRLAGYDKAISDAGLSYKRCINAKQIFINDGYEAATLLFDYEEKPDAIICVNDEIAIGVLKFLKAKGFSIPNEVAVVGFDDNPMGLICEPELTTLSLSIEELAKTLLHLLLKQIEEGTNIKEDVVLPMELKMRNSLY